MKKSLLIGTILISFILILSLAAYAQCQAPSVRNCNAECDHLPSYPTYEKEDCITACVDDSNAAQAAYDDCLFGEDDYGDTPDYYDDYYGYYDYAYIDNGYIGDEPIEVTDAPAGVSYGDPDSGAKDTAQAVYDFMMSCLKKGGKVTSDEDMSSIEDACIDAWADESFKIGDRYDACLSDCYAKHEYGYDCDAQCADIANELRTWTDDPAMERAMRDWEDSFESLDEPEPAPAPAPAPKPTPQPAPESKELPKNLEVAIFAAANLYHHHDSWGNREAADAYLVELLHYQKQAAEYLGEDPSKYDIFKMLKQLEEGQTSMSESEKQERMSLAELAYIDYSVDKYIYNEKKSKGQEDAALKQTIEDKSLEIQSQYGRVLLFDPDNVKANIAMGDLLREEGKYQDSEIFYRRSLKNLAKKDPDKFNVIRSRLGSEYHEEIAEKMGVKAPEKSSFMKSLGDDFVDSMKKAGLEISNEAKEIEIWVKSGMISKDMGEIFESFKETIFSISKKKAEEARDA
jgi:hypothetical protein